MNIHVTMMGGVYAISKTRLKEYLVYLATRTDADATDAASIHFSEHARLVCTPSFDLTDMERSTAADLIRTGF
jgi:hypothetical protein